MSDSSSVEPIDAVGAGGGVLFSGYLLYIYYRQNLILKNQQEVMESEMEIQEATTVEPRFNLQWEIEQDILYLEMDNIGEGDAFDVTLTSDITLISENGSDPTLEFRKHQSEVADRHPVGETENYSVPLRFESVEEGDFQTETFLEATQRIWRLIIMLTGSSSESAEFKIQLDLEYEDARGESQLENILNRNGEITKPATIRTGRSGNIVIEEKYPPNLAVDEWDIMPTDGLGLKIRNKGDLTAEDVSIHSVLKENSEIEEGNQLQSFDFSGTKLTPGEPVDKIEEEDEFVCTILFEVEGRSVDFDELTARLLKEGYSGEFSILFSVGHTDGMGFSMTKEFGRLGSVSINKPSSDAHEITESTSLYDVFREE
jgi:hypothetical protein